MHETMFRLKRAHLRAVEIAKPLAQKFGLTPAWFDVLSVVKHRAWELVHQADIAAALGLAKSTVSKMLQRMEARGLVRRAPSLADRRAIEVTLTPRGLDAIGAATHAFLRLGFMQKVYRSIHGDTAAQGARFVSIARRVLNEIARRFGDASTFAYPTRVPRAPAAERALDADIQSYRWAVQAAALRAAAARDAAERAAICAVDNARRAEISLLVGMSPVMFADYDKEKPDPPYICLWRLRRAYAYFRRLRVVQRRFAKIILEAKPVLLLPPAPAATSTRSA